MGLNKGAIISDRGVYCQQVVAVRIKELKAISNYLESVLVSINANFTNIRAISFDGIERLFSYHCLIIPRNPNITYA